MFDHIKWVGGPPNISAYDTRDGRGVPGSIGG
jgi:hypothetical protein